MKNSRNFYKSCDSLPIYNFYQILNTGDMSWMHKEHSVDDDPIEFKQKDLEEASEYWFEISNAYNEMMGEKTGNTRFKVMAQISELIDEHEIVRTLLNYHKFLRSAAIANEIEKWGYYPFDHEKSEKKLKGIEFRINMIKSKNKDLFPDEEREESQYDIFQDVILLENSLDNGIKIDPHTTPVTRWVKMILYNDKKNRDIKQKLNKDGSN